MASTVLRARAFLRGRALDRVLLCYSKVPFLPLALSLSLSLSPSPFVAFVFREGKMAVAATRVKYVNFSSKPLPSSILGLKSKRGRTHARSLARMLGGGDSAVYRHQDHDSVG